MLNKWNKAIRYLNARFYFGKIEVSKARPLVRNGTFKNGVNKNEVWIINDMDKSVVYVYHVSHDDIHTLDGTPVVNTKTWINKIKQFDTI